MAACVALTQRRFRSGEEEDTGRISRCGNALLRGYLFEDDGIVLHHMPLNGSTGESSARAATERATNPICRDDRRLWQGFCCGATDR
jgi:hypothetical protein